MTEQVEDVKIHKGPIHMWSTRRKIWAPRYITLSVQDGVIRVFSDQKKYKKGTIKRMEAMKNASLEESTEDNKTFMLVSFPGKMEDLKLMVEDAEQHKVWMQNLRTSIKEPDPRQDRQLRVGGRLVVNIILNEKKKEVTVKLKQSYHHPHTKPNHFHFVRVYLTPGERENGGARTSTRGNAPTSPTWGKAKDTMTFKHWDPRDPDARLIFLLLQAPKKGWKTATPYGFGTIMLDHVLDFEPNQDINIVFEESESNDNNRDGDRDRDDDGNGDYSDRDRDGDYSDRDRDRDGDYSDQDRDRDRDGDYSDQDRDRDRDGDYSDQDRDRNSVRDLDRHRDGDYSDRDRQRDGDGDYSDQDRDRDTDDRSVGNRSDANIQPVEDQVADTETLRVERKRRSSSRSRSRSRQRDGKHKKKHKKQKKKKKKKHKKKAKKPNPDPVTPHRLVNDDVLDIPLDPDAEADEDDEDGICAVCTLM